MSTMASHRTERAATDWIACSFLLVVSAVNIFLLVHFIPLFQQIYQEKLGMEPLLPSATSFLMRWKVLFKLFALIWPAAGIFVVCLSRNRNTVRLVLGFIFAAVLQAGFTTIILWL